MNFVVHRVRAVSVLLALVCSLAVAACGTTDDSQNSQSEEARSTPMDAQAEQPLGAEDEKGQELFVANCGACHTLDAAGTQGAIGPNLDEALVDEEEVLDAIANGGKGSGNMPAGLLEGADAQAVAKFVADSGPGT